MDLLQSTQVGMYYLNIRRYETHPDRIDSVVNKIKEGFVPILKSQPGFLGYDIMIAGTGVLVTMSKFESQEGAKNSRVTAAEWIAANVEDDFPNRPMIISGEVKFST